LEEYVAPKRTPGRQAFQEPHSMPDIDIMEEGLTDAGFDMETESFETESTAATTGEFEEEEEEELATVEEEDDEDPFSDRNRWRRGVLEDPDAGEW